MIRSKIMNLIIIGNGFDLAHKLPTSYCDFKKYLSSFEDGMKELVVIETLYDLGGPKWKNFESGLVKIKKTLDAERVINMFGYMDVCVVTKKIQDRFVNWIRCICKSYNYPPVNEYKLDTNDLYFTFNYTHTLHDAYGIDSDNINHIHGCAIGVNFMGINEIKFGHEKGIKSDDANQQKLLDETIKDVDNILCQNRKYFENLKSQPIEAIKVFGCSCSDIDFPYFEKIKECLPDARWEIGWHDDDGKLAAETYMKRLGIDQSRGKVLPNDDLFDKKPSLKAGDNN